MSLSPVLKKYLAIGLGVYIFELAVILTSQAAGASPVAAVSIGFWLGLVVSFIMHKLVTFEDRRTQHKILIPQMVAYSLLVLFNFFFTILVTKLLQDVAPAVICRTLALGMTTIWNFYLYKTRIFKTPIIS
jgi:putative flippase GtrA